MVDPVRFGRLTRPTQKGTFGPGRAPGVPPPPCASAPPFEAMTIDELRLSEVHRLRRARFLSGGAFAACNVPTWDEIDDTIHALAQRDSAPTPRRKAKPYRLRVTIPRAQAEPDAADAWRRRRLLAQLLPGDWQPIDHCDVQSDAAAAHWIERYRQHCARKHAAEAAARACAAPPLQPAAPPLSPDEILRRNLAWIDRVMGTRRLDELDEPFGQEAG